MRAAGIQIAGSADKRVLEQIGYFHGYKGYRYSGAPTRRLPYATFAELKAVVAFDMSLKALFYPVLMRLEMTMKNLALNVMLDDAASSALSDVYAKLMPGNKANKLSGKLEVIHSSNGVLLQSYKNGKNSANLIVRHYYDSPSAAVPVWGLMEVITLGHFGKFLEQLSDPTLNAIAECWGIERKYGELIPKIVLTMTALRNCVAHNGVVFDTRFATGKVRQEVRDLLQQEVGFAPNVTISFDTITDYFVLLVYLACAMSFPKREINAFIKSYSVLTDELYGKVPLPIFSMIVHSDNRTKIRTLSGWVRGQ